MAPAKSQLALLMGLLLLLVGALLYARQHAGQPQYRDPVFAAGQVWRMDYQDSEGQASHALTVGPKLSAQYGVFAYRLVEKKTDGELSTTFWYDPLDDDPEYIWAKRMTTNKASGKRQTEWCLVREPGKIRVGQTRQGAFSTESVEVMAPKVFKTYLGTGDLKGQESCSLTRVK